jgi:hypothetical protein
MEGASEGIMDGASEGTIEGASEGTIEGASDGTIEGASLGTREVDSLANSSDSLSGVSEGKSVGKYSVGVISGKSSVGMNSGKSIFVTLTRFGKRSLRPRVSWAETKAKEARKTWQARAKFMVNVAVGCCNG